MKSIRRLTIFAVTTVVLALILSCAPPPSKSDVSEAIIRYFESQGYDVEELVISDISSQPISELKYMGTKGYHVPISRVTLVGGRRSTNTGAHRSGERLTLTEGVVIIREDLSRKGKWIVSSVSSNLAP